MSVPKIFTTKDYDLFEVLAFNRDVVKTADLELSMVKHGFIPAYPLHCVRNGNGKLKVKAGHHRLEVAKRLGLAVHYVVCDDTASIQSLEAATRPWSMRDYLTSFARSGLDDYQIVKDYVARTGITMAAAVSMFGGHSAGSGNINHSFKGGEYKVVDMQHPEDVACIVGKCKEYGVPCAKHLMFVNAISRLVRVPQFDAERFLHKVSANVTMMRKQPNLRGYMDMIEAVYNRNSQDKVPLAFMADEAMKKRNPATRRRAK